MENKKNNETELKCTCADEFQTSPCPVHSAQSQPPRYGGQDNIVTVRDDLLIPDPNMDRIWFGFSFKCPKCHSESILHFFKYCPECGVKVLLQSKIVTEHMKSQIKT